MASHAEYPETVTFECVDPDAAPGEYGSAEDPSPYLGVEAGEMRRSLAQLLDADAVVAPAGFFVRYNYPLSAPAVFKFTFPEPVTRREFARTLAAGYQRIYREEAESQSREPRTMAEKERDAMGPDGATPSRAGVLINRDATDGSHGIWGHVIGDLLINHAQRADVTVTDRAVEFPLYTLSVDS